MTTRLARHRKGRLGVLLAVILSACSQPIDGGSEAAIDREADEAAIRLLIASNAAASAARDAQGVAATYMEDGDAWIAGLESEPTTTHDTIAEMEEAFTSMPGFQSWEAEVDNIRFIAPDAAIVEVTGITNMESGSFEEKTTIVVARSTGNWRIAAWRVMEFDENLLEILQESSSEVLQE